MFPKRTKLCNFAFSEAVSSKVHEVGCDRVTDITDLMTIQVDNFKTRAIDKYRISKKLACENSWDFDLFEKYR